IPDPASPTGQSNVLVRRGNDPDLQPEKATSWTLGADLEPSFLPGLRASFTYYNLTYRDRITSPAAHLFNFLVNRRPEELRVGKECDSKCRYLGAPDTTKQ